MLYIVGIIFFVITWGILLAFVISVNDTIKSKKATTIVMIIMALIGLWISIIQLQVFMNL